MDFLHAINYEKTLEKKEYGYVKSPAYVNPFVVEHICKHFSIVILANDCIMLYEQADTQLIGGEKLAAAVWHAADVRVSRNTSL